MDVLLLWVWVSGKWTTSRANCKWHQTTKIWESSISRWDFHGFSMTLYHPAFGIPPFMESPIYKNPTKSTSNREKFNSSARPWANQLAQTHPSWLHSPATETTQLGKFRDPSNHRGPKLKKTPMKNGRVYQLFFRHAQLVHRWRDLSAIAKQKKFWSWS